MATSDSKASLRVVKRIQFGILSPDEIVSTFWYILRARHRQKYTDEILPITIDHQFVHSDAFSSNFIVYSG